MDLGLSSQKYVGTENLKYFLIPNTADHATFSTAILSARRKNIPKTEPYKITKYLQNFIKKPL